jgi:predicted O-methyltransferase YrrM
MLEWEDDTRLAVDDVDFALAPTDLQGAAPAVAEGAMLLRKPRWMVERYVALRTQIEAENIFELGIYEGGSTALLALLFRPRRLVAVDLDTSRGSAALNDFLTGHGMTDSVHPYFGVDQADRTRLEEIVTHEYASEPLDLVIDDASHLLAPTTASFNALFPRLRPGGLFVIEDWSWQHTRDDAVAEKLRTDERARRKLVERLEAGDAWPASDDLLSRLVLELVLTAAYAEAIVAEVVSMRRGWVVVQRGDASLDPDTFDISECYGALGRRLLHERRSAP